MKADVEYFQVNQIMLRAKLLNSGVAVGDLGDRVAPEAVIRTPFAITASVITVQPESRVIPNRLKCKPCAKDFFRKYYHLRHHSDPANVMQNNTDVIGRIEVKKNPGYETN